jgi:prepilin-type processing-associated H-X9-DG protein
MKPANTFTKKDIIVLLGCIVFLLANIAAINENSRKHAKEILCLSNLMKWGQIFQAYTADNDGFFHAREIGTISGYTRLWPYVYKPYYTDPMMRFCPTANNPRLLTGPFATWNYPFFGSFNPMLDPALYMPGESEYDPETGTVTNGYFTGSYGMNRYVENMKGGVSGTDPAYWRRAGLKGADKAPVLMDSMYFYYWGRSTDSPPEFDGDIQNEMNFICINRHTGYINVCFLDFSARKVGLKELWTLRHSRTFDTCGPWTICGFGGDAEACAAAWDAEAPWMKDFPEY